MTGRSLGALLVASVVLVACATPGRPTPPTAAPGTKTRVEVHGETPPPGAATRPAQPPVPSPSVGAPPPAVPSPPPPPERSASPAEAETAPPVPVEPSLPVPTTPSRLLVLNFDNADVEAVIQAVAEIVSFNYVLGPNVRGRKVTVQTIGKIPSDDVFNVLLTILEVNGLTAVKSGALYRIIARETAPQTPVRTLIGREPAADSAGDEVLTQIVPLRFLGAADAVTLLRPFVPAAGTVTAHRETNLLIVTDTAANIRRLLDILKLVDVEVALDELQIVPIQHADAQELAQLLSQLFSSGRLRAAALPGGTGPPAPPPPPPATQGPGPMPRPTTGATEPGTDRGPLIIAERRSNSLVVHARKQDMETIRRLIDKLDVDIYGGQRVFIYFAENTRARDLATTLDAIYGRGDRGPAITGVQPPRPSGPAGPAGTLPPPPPPPPVLPMTAPRSGLPGTGGPGVPIEGAPPQAEVRFVADEVTNAVITTTYPRLWKEIEETTHKLDRMPRQVLIEVLAAEVTLTDDTKLGIEWAVRSGRFDVSGSPSGTLPGRPSPGLIPLGGAVPIGLNLFTFAADKFLAALNALATENKVNVLSNPSVMTSENKKAVINVSTSVPIVTSQQVPVATGGITGNAITQTVEYRDAGVILTVTPRIGDHGTVSLDVKQEVNEVGAPEPPPINSPRFTKREAETSVVLLNRQTLVLGGLIQTKRTLNRTGIPFLNRIPILGLLFGSTEEKIEKTELVLLITPRVVGTAVEAAHLTDERRRVTPELEESIRRAPRPPPSAPIP
jgi:general secretion pathway protein D